MDMRETMRMGAEWWLGSKKERKTERKKSEDEGRLYAGAGREKNRW